MPLGLLNAGRRTAIMRLMVGGEVGVRASEWVDVDLLREGISIAIFQMAMPPLVPWQDWQLHCLIVLIALTGTDFSRNLPLVKPKKLWAIVSDILPVLIRCFRMQAEQPEAEQPEAEQPEAEQPAAVAPKVYVDVDQTIETLVPSIYKGIFPAHVRDSQSFGATMASIRASKLGERTKQLLPSEGRAACTVCNANFLLDYWTLAKPDSMKKGFGFRIEGGAVAWDE